MADQTILQETLDNNIVDGDWLIYWKTSTGVQRRVARSSLLGATLTGAGTIATGGFTLTVPATGTAALKTGTPTAGQVAQWDDANTVESAGFAASDVARLSQTNTFTNTNVFNGNVIANAPISGYRYASGSVDLNDDAIGTIPNVGDRGMMLVFTNSGSTEAALVAYRTTATNGFAAVLAQTSNIMEGIYGAGSPVFSAATDGRIAIYAGQDGVLSVINRRGGARGVRWVAFV